jgi:hypothetical protein
VKAPDPALEVLWKHTLDNWDNDAAHRAFLEHCERHEVLDEAAVRYRGMKGDRDKGSGAEQRLKAILALALAKLSVQRAEPKAASSTLTKVLLIVVFLSGSLLVLAYLLST